MGDTIQTRDFGSEKILGDKGIRCPTHPHKTVPIATPPISTMCSCPRVDSAAVVRELIHPGATLRARRRWPQQPEGPSWLHRDCWRKHMAGFTAEKQENYRSPCKASRALDGRPHPRHVHPTLFLTSTHPAPNRPTALAHSAAMVSLRCFYFSLPR